MYVPFGVFESSMISDPFTLDLAETNQSALLLGYRRAGFQVRAYGFNCDVDEFSDGDREQVECFGASAGYGRESEEGLSYQFEAGYISSIVDTDGYGDFVTEQNLELLEREGGYSVFAKFSYDSFTLIGEFVSGTGDIAFASGTEEAPLAWNTEFDYGLSLMGKEAVIALGYQATDNMAGRLPKSRILGSASVALVEGLSVGFEYSHDEDYKESDGGSDNNADAVAMQLALEF